MVKWKISSPGKIQKRVLEENNRYFRRLSFWLLLYLDINLCQALHSIREICATYLKTHVSCHALSRASQQLSLRIMCKESFVSYIL